MTVKRHTVYKGTNNIRFLVLEGIKILALEDFWSKPRTYTFIKYCQDFDLVPKLPRSMPLVLRITHLLARHCNFHRKGKFQIYVNAKFTSTNSLFSIVSKEETNSIAKSSLKHHLVFSLFYSCLLIFVFLTSFNSITYML